MQLLLKNCHDYNGTPLFIAPDHVIQELYSVVYCEFEYYLICLVKKLIKIYLYVIYCSGFNGIFLSQQDTWMGYTMNIHCISE